MKPGHASRTAVMVCMGRAAAHGTTRVARFSDPTALALLPDAARARVERYHAGAPPRGVAERVTRRYLAGQAQVMVARTVEIDDAVRAAASPQVVMLGAGLDGRAWRMAELRDVVVFEVDHPDSQRDKRARVASLTPVARFFEQVHPIETDVTGVVRITAPPGVIDVVVLPALGELVRRHPGLRFEVDASQAIANLSRREADVAVRFVRPTGEGLVIRRVATSPTAVFASPSLGESLGVLDSLDRAPWISWDAAHAEIATARWFRATVGVAPVVRASTLLAQFAAVEASVGVALLPVLVAEKRGLVRVRMARGLANSTAFPADDIYLACHAAIRSVPRVKAVWASLLEAFLRISRDGTIPG